MTATLTRTKTGKTRRVPKQAKNPPMEDEVAGDDERDELGHQHQQTGGTTADRTATTEQDGGQRGPRVAEREAEIAMTDAPSNESGQPTTQVEETTTTNTSDDATTMDAAAMTAAIQYLMTAAGLQPGTATTGSKRNQKKPMTKTRLRAGADDDEDGRARRTNQQRVTTQDAHSTAARIAPSTTNPTTRNAAPSGGPSTGEQAAGTPATGTPDTSAMAAAIRDLTAMVSGLQPAEPNEGERGRRMQRRTTRGATRTRRTTPDSSDSSSRSSHTHRRRARTGHRSRRRRGNGGGDGDSSSSSDDSSSSSSGSSSPSSESGDGWRRGSRSTEPPARDERPPGRRSVKDLELPTFTPSRRCRCPPGSTGWTWLSRAPRSRGGVSGLTTPCTSS
ncbi:hypothetical protein PR002_g22658 [Phytophthora rubi]|uniref:Uncharacterized protein n=1 Tax=Phytophthora rubi TaxID=129364 RepID=A0A6A3IYK6_9STRA|nr:hypothetical protein PR002_g22658 [Phytophthora rubi]